MLSFVNVQPAVCGAIIVLENLEWKCCKMKTTAEKKKGFDYKWIVAVLCFLVMFAGLGFCSTAKNAYFQPVTEAQGFSRGAFGVSDTFRYATTSVVPGMIGTMVLPEIASLFWSLKVPVY